MHRVHNRDMTTTRFRSEAARAASMKHEACLAALRNYAWYMAGEMSDDEWAEMWNSGQDDFKHEYREAVRRIEAAVWEQV